MFYGSVAALAAHTLQSVFGVQDPGTLEYKAFPERAAAFDSPIFAWHERDHSEEDNSGVKTAPIGELSREMGVAVVTQRLPEISK